MLDAPVSGGERGAIDAALSIMVGGDDAAFGRAVPVFEALGKNIVHVGPSGAGQVCKACNQLVVAATIEAVAEALLLAERSGVDAAKVREACSAASPARRSSRCTASGCSIAPSTRASASGCIARTPGSSREPLPRRARRYPSFAVVTEQLQKAVDAGDGERDHAALYAELAREADSPA